MIQQFSRAYGGLFILACLAVIGVFFRSFLFVNIVQPIALLVWAGWLVVASVDQHLWWAIVIAACVLLMVRLLVPAGVEVRSSAYHQDTLPPSRLEHWVGLLEAAGLSRDERLRMYDGLSILLQSVIDMDNGNGLDIPVNGQGSSNRLLVDEMRHALAEVAGAAGRAESSRGPDALVWVPRWMRRIVRRLGPEDERLIRRTLTLMETRLDIHHADQNPD